MIKLEARGSKAPKHRAARRRIVRRSRRRTLPRPDLATLACVDTLADNSFWEPLPAEVADWMGMPSGSTRTA